MPRRSRLTAALSSPASPQEVVDSQRAGPTPDLFSIGELSAAFGITPRALRFYEDKGLLSPQRVNGNRVYTRRDKARLTLILRSKAIGFPLAEIEHYLDLYGTQGEGRDKQLRFVLERTDAAIASMEAKRAHIEAALAELRLINQDVRARLRQAPRR